MNRRHFLQGGTFCAGAAAIERMTLGAALNRPAHDPSSATAQQMPGGGTTSPDSVGQPIDLREAVVVVRPGALPPAESAAATVLIEEVEKRTRIMLPRATTWPQGKVVIAITSTDSVPAWGRAIPARHDEEHPERRPEGYRIYVDALADPPVVWITGADPRGTLFGVGNLLRRLDWSESHLSLAADVDIATAPAFAIRGHQLGYRAQANSYDAWSPAQFEQYIRELTFFGLNSVEGIPFQDDRSTPVMKFPRREMNRAIGEICQRYGLDYWVWVPVDFSLEDHGQRAQMLKQCAEFFHDTPELTGFFYPGGDPGHNPPELFLPFLEEVAKLLDETHPHAKIWLSVQQFVPEKVDYVYHYIEQQSPHWLGGLVAGPSSPPLRTMRSRLPKQYKLRDYPDLTHNKLCQYEVPEWDLAFALTEGREAVNPRPVEFSAIFSHTSVYTDGFISYSDGVHDDVNKTIWSALSWNPDLTPREILAEYARVYFQPAAAGQMVDAILALEKSWHGPLMDNGAVAGTLLQWEQLAKAQPELETNWRWQMCLLRANYDSYVRRRLIHETQLESNANAILANAEKLGAARAMDDATRALDRAITEPVGVELHTRISELCDQLFHSIGLQTSVEKYYAIGEERGAVLDFVDYPLNNRWWLEDQFKVIRTLGSESEKDRRLHQLATWEHPGPGSFYDNVGNIAKAPHVVRCDPENAPQLSQHPRPTFWWWNEGKSRARLSWQVTMWPTAVVYEGLDPTATYVVRSTGLGQALLRINGDRVEPAIDGKQMDDFKEFPVPAAQVETGRLILTWDPPINEEHLNWRQRSRLSEAWLIKQPRNN